MVGRVRFELTQPEAADLQSAPALQLRRLPIVVSVERFELPTHCSQSSCATRLRYTELLGGTGWN